VQPLHVRVALLGQLAGVGPFVLLDFPFGFDQSTAGIFELRLEELVSASYSIP
jgi:hypothetical protein